MSNETINTTNKLIKPEDISTSDDEVIRQLSENLQDITTEDINTMCDKMDISRISDILKHNRTIKKKLALEDATLMIDNGYYKLILKNIDKFKKEDHKSIMLKIIRYLGSQPEEWNINCEIDFSKIHGLDKEVALEIFQTGNKKLLGFLNVSHYKNLDDEIAKWFIDWNYEGYLAKYIKYFPINLKKTILLLAKTQTLASFYGLRSDNNWLDDEKFEDDLIATKYPYMITGNISDFPNKNHKRIALKLIKAGFGKDALDQLKNFKGLDKETAIAFIDAGCYHGKSLDSLCYFGGSDVVLDKEIVMKILNDKQTSSGQREWIAKHPKLFIGLDPEVAMILINKGFSGYVANSQEYYKNLNDEVANALIDNGYPKLVKEHIGEYIGITMKTKWRLWRKAR